MKKKKTTFCFGKPFCSRSVLKLKKLTNARSVKVRKKSVVISISPVRLMVWGLAHSDSILEGHVFNLVANVFVLSLS